MANNGLALDKSTVRSVADLANLKLSNYEVDYYQVQLCRILDYVSELGEIAQTGERHIGPAGLAFQCEPRERPDLCRNSLDPRVALLNATKTSDTTFQVPRIID